METSLAAPQHPCLPEGALAHVTLYGVFTDAEAVFCQHYFASRKVPVVDLGVRARSTTPFPMDDAAEGGFACLRREEILLRSAAVSLFSLASVDDFESILALGFLSGSGARVLVVMSPGLEGGARLRSILVRHHLNTRCYLTLEGTVERAADLVLVRMEERARAALHALAHPLERT